ncbi:hypothetical protein [Cellulomonas sp. NPDC089187]|uniref:hypothetical protein n=1 Tax=Cellulomonas sp. NPDC089187 TaxID=3154970 RepID=UPI00343F075D
MKKLNDVIGAGAIALPIQASTFGWVQGSGVSVVDTHAGGGFAPLGTTGRLRGSGVAPAHDSVGTGLLS